MVKFVDTRQEATKMGIVGIKFYGFNRKIILAGEETRVGIKGVPMLVSEIVRLYDLEV